MIRSLRVGAAIVALSYAASLFACPLTLLWPQRLREELILKEQHSIHERMQSHSRLKTMCRGGLTSEKLSGQF